MLRAPFADDHPGQQMSIYADRLWCGWLEQHLLAGQEKFLDLLEQVSAAESAGQHHQQQQQQQEQLVLSSQPEQRTTPPFFTTPRSVDSAPAHTWRGSRPTLLNEELLAIMAPNEQGVRPFPRVDGFEQRSNSVPSKPKQQTGSGNIPINAELLELWAPKGNDSKRPRFN